METRERFNLKKYLENPTLKVENEKGQQVRILATDLKGDFPIAVAIENDECSDVYTCHDTGFVNGDEPSEYGLDLFFSPIVTTYRVQLNLDSCAVFYVDATNEEDAEKIAREKLKKVSVWDYLSSLEDARLVDEVFVSKA